MRPSAFDLDAEHRLVRGSLEHVFFLSRRSRAAFCLAALLSIALVISCGPLDGPSSPDEPSLPTGTPNDPYPTPTPRPTPSGAWGFVDGSATVVVSNLPSSPYTDKEVIFCIGNPDHSNWVNVRHRSGNKFQLKGGLDPTSACLDEVNVHEAQPAGNGTWTVQWDSTGRVTVSSPSATETINIPGGVPAWRGIYPGSCGGYITWNSPATISVDFQGRTIGYPSDCTL